MRPALNLIPARTPDGQEVWGFADAEGLTTMALAVSPALGVLLAELLDGTRDRAALLRDWQEATAAAADAEKIDEILHALDQALLLEGARADAARAAQCEAYRRQLRRPARSAGTSYAADGEVLAAEIARWRAASGVEPVAGPVRAVLAPHIDPRGGGACHGAAVAALAACPAEIFVILGTAHEPLRHPFVLTSLDFDTPAGVIPTDRGIVEALATRGGGGLLDEEQRHASEHSVEFQASWLKVLHGSREGLRIVPVLVGSIHEHLDAGTPPEQDAARRDFVEALRELKAHHGDTLAFVASVDFAHVGPAYGDAEAPDEARLAEVLRADRGLLDSVAQIDARGWFEGLAAEQNARHVCGAAPTWVLLATLEGEGLEALTLRHDVWEIDPESGSQVSFATVAFCDPTREEEA